MAAKGEETMLLMPGKKKVDKGKDVIIAIINQSKCTGTIKEALRAGGHVRGGTGVAAAVVVVVVVVVVIVPVTIHLSSISTTTTSAPSSSTSVVRTAATALWRGGIGAVAATGRHTAALRSRVVRCVRRSREKREKEEKCN